MKMKKRHSGAKKNKKKSFFEMSLNELDDMACDGVDGASEAYMSMVRSDSLQMFALSATTERCKARQFRSR